MRSPLQKARDRDRLLERFQRLAAGAARPAHGGDRVPEGAGAEAELEAAARERLADPEVNRLYHLAAREVAAELE